MASKAETTRPVRILCIDGGGIRGIFPLHVLKALKSQTGKEPWELFDLICGTSTGGIIAILLGIMKIPVEDCLTFYKSFGKEVFTDVNPTVATMKKALQAVWGYQT